MKKKIKFLSKSQRIKLFVETFEKSNISFQDIIDEYNQLKKRKDGKTTSK
jgi:hypothetical protein